MQSHTGSVFTVQHKIPYCKTIFSATAARLPLRVVPLVVIHGDVLQSATNYSATAVLLPLHHSSHRVLVELGHHTLPSPRLTLTIDAAPPISVLRDCGKAIFHPFRVLDVWNEFWPIVRKTIDVQLLSLAVLTKPLQSSVVVPPRSVDREILEVLQIIYERISRDCG